MSEQRLPLPLIVIEGAPRERGIAYGNACRERIRATIDFYRFIFQEEGKLDWKRALAMAAEFADPIGTFDPDMLAEMEGIAQGAGAPLNEILAINARSELLFLLKSTATEHPACTSLAKVQTDHAEQPILLAQNWDWYVNTIDNCILLLIKQPPRPTILQVVEAGLVAKMGMNSSGIGLCTNALVTDGWRIGVPYHAILRGILNAKSMAEAIGAVTKPTRASAANYLIGHRDGFAVDLEASPAHVNILAPQNGVLVHTNHFVQPNPVNTDRMPGLWTDSIVRELRARQLCEKWPERIGTADMINVLTDHFDHPGGICTHPCGLIDPDLEWQTNVSLIMDLKKGAMLVSKGPACRNGHFSVDARVHLG